MASKKGKKGKKEKKEKKKNVNTVVEPWYVDVIEENGLETPAQASAHCKKIAKKNKSVRAKAKKLITLEGCTFRYHPNPLATESCFKLDEAVRCDCCGKMTKVRYVAAFYSVCEYQPDICPQCIQSGAAAKKYDGCFTVDYGCPDIGDDARRDEVAYRTPGYTCIQQERWLTHCDDYCAYLGEITYQDLTDALREELIISWPADCGYEPQQAFDSLGYNFEGHLFQCLHCGMHLLLAERD